MKKSKTKKNNLISSRVRGINFSYVKKGFTVNKNKNFINAGIGQPDFDVPDSLKEQAIFHIRAGHNRYTEVKGILPLREAISKYLNQKNISRGVDEIIVTSGTTSAIFMTMFSLIEEGDEVIIFEPFFVAYTEIVKMVGGKPVIIKTDKNFQPDLDKLKKAITKKTKLIILNSPNNPTGAVYSKEIIQEIVKVASKAGIYILSDEIYSSFVYETTHYSPAEIYEKTIIVDGLSKSKGMTGWRLGFIAGPKDIIDAVEKVQQFSSVCAPAPFQYAAASDFSSPLSPTILAQYKKRRDTLIAGIKNNYSIVVPQGAFYLFIKAPVAADIFINLLAEKGLGVIPGKVFGHYKNYVRFSYAISDEKIAKAVNILQQVAKKMTADPRLGSTAVKPSIRR